MGGIDDILTESLSATIREWFEPNFDHPFMSIPTVCVPDSIKPIPKRWVDEVQIDEGLFREEFDACGDFNVPSSWVVEGEKKLRESIERLGLAEDHIAHPRISSMNRHELAMEKRRVKQELKRYDVDFRKQFARLPTHTEKEPMRPLYVYYRRLKGLISQAEQLKHRGAARNMNNEELRGTPNFSAEPPSARKHPNHEELVSSLEARIESLQADKSQVRAKLTSFQEKFVTENNRKIRFHKDILPIEREYRMYKNLKEEIAKAESQLRDLKGDSGQRGDI